MRVGTSRSGLGKVEAEAFEAGRETALGFDVAGWIISHWRRGRSAVFVELQERFRGIVNATDADDETIYPTNGVGDQNEYPEDKRDAVGVRGPWASEIDYRGNSPEIEGGVENYKKDDDEGKAGDVLAIWWSGLGLD